MKNLFLFCLFFLLLACSLTSTPKILNSEPEKSDLTKTQAGILSGMKVYVPCRIELNAPDSAVGYKTGITGKEVLYYPLYSILLNSFDSSVYTVFAQPGGEVLESFTLGIRIPESRLVVSGSTVQYFMKAIATLYEPGGKKIVAVDVSKHRLLIADNDDQIINAVYDTARDVAFGATRKLISDPKVIKIIDRFKDF